MKYSQVLSVVFLCCLSSCQTNKPDTFLLTKGISLELANYRKQQVSDVKYALQFSIPAQLSKKIAANMQLNLNILDLKHDLYLDFNEQKSLIHTVKVNGVAIEIQHKKEHLIISKKYLIKGKNTIVVSFTAGELSLNRNEDFLYTLLVPDRASTLFPCFDQPNIKARYSLTITAPKDWKVLCGGVETKKETSGDITTHWFSETDPMSTYLFSFVAGKFSEASKNPGKFTMHFLYRENDPKKIKESVDKIFKIHQQAIDFLENYTQFPFPFQKLDFVAIPPFQYGGMEHVGAIQYRQSSLFLDKEATQSQLLRRAKLLAHETSHMWFGDLVTMNWFDDVWMKEVFANFMADKIMNPVFPKINHALQFTMTHYPNAYSEDRTKGTNVIHQQLANLKDAGSLYGQIIYDKAPIMMRQLENEVGKEGFKKGIQQYIKKYAYNNATWNDLVTLLDNQSPKDIKKWSKIWVNSSSRPIFSDSILYKNGRIQSFNLSQKAEDGSDKVWSQSFVIGLVYAKQTKIVKINIDHANQSYKELVGLKKPQQIIYNYNGFGYGVFPINLSNISAIKNIKDDVARGYAYINLYENFLNYKIPAQQAYNTFLAGVQNEKNELISRYLTGRVQTIFWTFLNDAERLKVQAPTEKILLKILSAHSKISKKSIFGLYKSIANSKTGLSVLYSVWNHKKSYPDLHLNESDYTSLAMQLAIYKHPKTAEILEKQASRIKNLDRLARFKWLLPSLSNNVAVRDAFMKSLANPKNREKESWVQAALGNLNHPLRQEMSVKYIPLCLNLLAEIQLTGDIFFPKGWLSSSVGRYHSKEAYDKVQAFLTAHPNYNPILKKKLLQSVDNLFRAQKIRH